MKLLPRIKLIPLLSGISVLSLSFSAHAVEFTTSGFVSVVAGTVLGGKEGDYLQNVSGYDCPCFVADYANAGIYEGNSWSFAPDSRAGLQVATRFNDELAFTVQGVGHGANDMKPELTAMYLSWQVNANLSFNAGRQRLPLFYYSDFYDVGYAYPWIRVPTDLYGWPINSYNGANAIYNDDLGDGTYRISLFGGQEHREDDVQNGKIYWASPSFSTEWNNMFGAAASYIYDWFDVRVIYMQNTVDAKVYYGPSDPNNEQVNDGDKQKFAGLAFNIDYHNILVKTEMNHFEVGDGFDSTAKMLAAGYRMGDFTPMLTYSRYDDSDVDFGRSSLTTRSFSVRWDAMKNFAVKLQFDMVGDGTRWISDSTTTPVSYYKNFIGSTRAMSVGVDYVF